jgi:PAS domain S-box-containing protein
MLTWFGLRFRLVLLVFFALLPVVGLLAYSALKSQDTALELAQARLQSQVLRVAAHQQQLFERINEVLDGMAGVPSIKDGIPAVCAQYLSSLQAQHPELDQVGLLGLDGRPACISEPRADAQDQHEAQDAAQDQDEVQDEDQEQAIFFRQVLAGELFAVGQYGHERSGMGFGVLVHDRRGRVSGVAFAVVGLQKLSGFFDAVALLPGTTAVLLDPRATVLAAHPPAPAWLGRPHPDAAVQQAVQARLQGLHKAPNAQADPQLYAFAPVPGAGAKGLLVAISQPHALVAEQARATLALELLAALAMVLFGMACAWAVGHRLIVNPARAILKQTDEFGRGNLAARVGISPLYPDEIGQIGLAFNRMAQALQARQDELDAALRASDKERTLLDLVLNSMSDGVIAVDTASCILLSNACAAQLYGARPRTGATLAEWRRPHELLTLDGKTAYSLLEHPLEQALRGVSLDKQELLFRMAGQRDRILKLSTRPLYGAGRELIGGVAIVRDITERKAAERFALAQEQVLTLMAQGAALPDSLQAIVQLIEASAPGNLCAIWQVQDQRLCDGVADSLPADFMQALNGMPIAQEGCPCAIAAFRKEPLVVEDVASDPVIRQCRAVLLAHQLRACWSTPVLCGEGEVLAVFAVYRRQPARPEAADLALIETASRLARIALARVQAELALVSSEARFREMAENINDVFYNMDAVSHRVRYVSPAYEKLWGRSCQSLYARPGSHIDAVLPEDRAALALADQLNDQGQSSDVAYRILSGNGQLRWIRDRSYPVFNADGVLERVVGTACDITDTKRAELVLASANRALQMLSRSSIAIHRIEEETSLLAEVCRVAVEVGCYRMAWVGYMKHDEKHGLQPMAHAGEESGYLDGIEISWDADQPSGQGPAGQAIRSGQPAQRSDISADPTFYWRAAALQRSYRSVIALPLREAGRSFGVLCLYRSEIEFFSADEVRLLQELADNLAFGIGSLRARLERLRSQEVAHQAALKLREQAALLDHAQDAIIVRNLDGSVRFWNQGAQRLYGWSAQEALGRTLEMLMYRDPQALATAMSQTLDKGGDWSAELEQLARDGSVVHVASRCSVVRDEQGRINGVLSINTDIGERRRAHEAILSLNASLEERVRQRTAQLQRANEQLEAFSYSVSHDLRSPLSAIDGFSHLLQKSMAKLAESEPLAERSQNHLAHIRAGVVQMGELIDGLLSLAQVSRSSLRWEAVDLSAMAQDLLKGYQRREPGRASRCQVEPGLLAQGDARLLRQVLDNLLGNAWKFTGAQACTEIALSHETGPSGETVYVVRDNGAGFDMAHASGLFIAFERLHTQAEFPGTGIGLATVARIIERHGGRIWADAATGQGARFYFTLGVQAP